jgi:hypothetical protein
MSGGRPCDKGRADDTAPVYSVLIPLEFTRGMAERCVAAWTSEQRYARERFEILIAAPTDHDPTAGWAASWPPPATPAASGWPCRGSRSARCLSAALPPCPTRGNGRGKVH